jgi:hypothetical protein
VHEVIDKEGC